MSPTLAIRQAVLPSISATAGGGADARRERRAAQRESGHALLRRCADELWPARSPAIVRDGERWRIDPHAHPHACAAVAHSGRHIIAAVASRGRIGVDVEDESRRPPALEDARGFVDASSLDRLLILPEDQRAHAFIRLWTAFEAFGKAIQRDLLPSIQTPLFGDDGRLSPAAFHNRGLALYAYNSSNMAYAIVADTTLPVREVAPYFRRVHDWTGLVAGRNGGA